MAAYSGANSGMDLLAAAINAQQRAVAAKSALQLNVTAISINWDDWQFSDYDGQQVGTFFLSNRHALAIPPFEGVAVLFSVLAATLSHQVDSYQWAVSTTSLAHRLSAWTTSTFADSKMPNILQAKVVDDALLPVFPKGFAVGQEGEGESLDLAEEIMIMIQNILTTLVGVPFGAETDFFDAGGDSLTASIAVVRVNEVVKEMEKRKTQKAFRALSSVKTILDFRTPRELTSFLLSSDPSTLA